MTTFPESHHDLLDADVATLATIGRNCMPQQTAVWFLHEDGKLKLSLNTSRLEDEELDASARSAASWFLTRPSHSVISRCEARLRSSPTTTTRSPTRWGAKYGGADLSEHDGPGDSRVIVTIEPTNVYAVDVRVGQM